MQSYGSYMLKRSSHDFYANKSIASHRPRRHHSAFAHVPYTTLALRRSFASCRHTWLLSMHAAMSGKPPSFHLQVQHRCKVQGHRTHNSTVSSSC
eukprot:766751-Hanusia_phi.AAC.18